MGTADSADDSSTVHSKSVMLTAYFGGEEHDDWRQAAGNLPVDSDYSAKDTSVLRDHRLVVGDTEEAEEAGWSDREDHGVSVSEEFSDMVYSSDTGGLSTVTFRDKVETYNNGGYEFSREFRKLVGMKRILIGFDQTPDRISFKTLETDSGAEMSYNFSKPEMMKTLKHASEASNDERYEDGSEPRPAISLTVELEGGSPDDINWLSNTVMPVLVRQVANVEGVQETRIRDCERTVTQEGACYEL